MDIKSIYTDKKTSKRKCPSETTDADPMVAKKKPKRSKKNSAIDMADGLKIAEVNSVSHVDMSNEVEVKEKVVVNPAELCKAVPQKVDKSKKDIALNNSEKKKDQKVFIENLKLIFFFEMKVNT
jgi:hypothetical protein